MLLRQSENFLQQKMVEGDEEVSVVPGTSAGNNMDFATPEKQEARAFLRERFLRVITGIIGRQAEFFLHEDTWVYGQFRGCNVDFSEIFVRNLETPMGTIPESILRSSDVIQFNVGEVTKPPWPVDSDEQRLPKNTTSEKDDTDAQEIKTVDIESV